MTPLNRSLNAKLLLIVMCVVALGGLMAAYRQVRVETERLQITYDQRLQRLAANYQRRLAEELSQRQLLLSAAHNILLERLFDQDQQLSATTSTLVRDADQAWRQFDGISAVFVPKDKTPDTELLHYVAQTQSLWDQIIPLLSTSFNAVYFISDSGMTRVWPAQIVAEHRADYHVTQEVFFSLVTPVNDPSREFRWTPMYYDAYSKAWMISLVFPVYRQDTFVGAMGADLNIGVLFNELSNLNLDSDDIKAFIFNDDGKLILHSEQLLTTQGQAQSVYVSHQPNTKDSNFLEYIRNAIAGEFVPGEVAYQELNGVKQHISYYPLENMNWYISLYYSDAVIVAKLKNTLVDIYTNIIILMVFLFLIIYFSLNYFVVKRISVLARATALVSQGNWTLVVPQQGYDEISFLGRCINVMLDKINDLIHGLNRNIVELEKANTEAKKLIVAIENSTSIVVIFNKDWVLEYANACFWQVSGYSLRDKLMGEMALLYVPGTDGVPELNDIVAALCTAYQANPNRRNDWRSEYLAQRKDGSRFWLTQSISGIFSDDGELEYFIAVGQDSSDLKQNQQKIENLAYYDHLTGLHNRVLFKDHLRTAVQICQRDKTHFALMYLDLDHFKRINDTLGHEAGDTLLVEVASRIKGCLRDEDVVARLGGDEFAVLLHQVGSAQYAYKVANKIIAALNIPLHISAQEIVIGVSIGITLAPDDSVQLDALMKNADLAMYQAKEKGRNTFQFYTADMNYQVESRLALESDLRQALKNQEFELFYQPVIDLRSNKIVAAEALLRWRHPQRGLVSPLEFITVAEESGLIVPIGRWVVRTACQQAKNIQKALHRPLRIAVNVSARQLHDNDFVLAVKLALDEIKLAPEWLSVELTETTLMTDGDKAIEQLKQIRALGVNIAIDDFGTGYSSLSHLKRLPVDTLKIDRSFVEGLPGDEEDRAITTLIVAMATSLNYKVVVEGVEASDQLAFLTLCGCDYAQGFYFSHPLPADQLMQLLFSEEDVD